MFVSNMINSNDLRLFADEVQDLDSSLASRALDDFINDNANVEEFTAKQTARGWEIGLSRTFVTDDVGAFAQLINSVAGVNWK